MILNWNNEEITMIKTNEYDNNKLANFGFTPIIEGEKIFIGYIYNKSSADIAGLKLGDQILAINGKAYNKVSWDCWCDIREHSIADDLNLISITVLRKEQKLIFDLKKTTIFE